MSTNRLPRTLLEAVRYFDDPQVCIDFVAGLRWTDGPVCPRCESPESTYLATRRVWKCRSCKKQYSVKVGTIFEDSPLGLDKWLVSIWLIANSKNGISSHELGRSVGITQKSAWFVLHRIRLAMRIGSFDKFDGIVESDETRVGGLVGNMHKAQADVARMKGTEAKTIVAGTLQRTTPSGPSQVRAQIVPNTRRRHLVGHVQANVNTGATVFTDAAHAYRSLDAEFHHEFVDHTVQYVNGRVSTNGIENFWSLLKRGIHGTYVAVSPWHLNRYVDERVFTFNERTESDLSRFRTVLSRIAGRRLTYEVLISGS
jgi:transposase-like protein